MFSMEHQKGLEILNILGACDLKFGVNYAIEQKILKIVYTLLF